MDNQHKTVKDSLSDAFKTDTPPKDFLDLRKASIPPSYEIAKGRVEHNLCRFKTYYLGVTLLFVTVFVLLKPSFLFFLGIGILSFYLHKKQLTLRGYTLTPSLVNLLTAVCLLVTAFLFSNTLVSILALVSLTSITILSHALTLEKGEDKEEGV